MQGNKEYESVLFVHRFHFTFVPDLIVSLQWSFFYYFLSFSWSGIKFQKEQFTSFCFYESRF